MSILTVCQNASRLLSVKYPETLINSGNAMSLKLLEALIMAGKYRRRSFEWPQLVRTQTITMTSGVDTYSLNNDFIAFISNTIFDVNNSTPMEGALPAWTWAYLKYGIGDASPYIKFRVAGRTNKRFQVYPAPTTSGAQITFQYLSGTWILPQEWEASKTYTAGTYVSNLNGDMYVSTTSATSGSTEPTHTTGVASDGGVQWSFYDSQYERPTHDNDFSVLDEDLLEQDLIWCFKKLSGIDYQSFKQEADEAWRFHFAQMSGYSTIRLGRSNDDSFLIGIDNLPYTGYAL